MVNLMKKYKEIAKNLFLASQIVIMIFFIGVSWHYSLEINENTNNFFGKKLFSMFTTSEVQSNTYKNIYDYYPLNIAQKKNGQVYCDLYDKTSIINAYNSVKSTVINVLNDENVAEISVDEYNTAFDLSNFIYIEFMSPSQDIAEILMNEYLYEMIIFENFAYYKTDEKLYKSTVFGTKLDLNFVESAEFYRNSSGENILTSSQQIDVKMLEKEDQMLNVDYNEIIKMFEYNPLIVENYYLEDEEVAYINEFSTITINENYIEFKSHESRGNIFKDGDLSTDYAMIEASKLLFNKVYLEINSVFQARTAEIKTSQNQTIIVLDGIYNGVSYKDSLGIFVYTQAGLSYAKINFAQFVESDNNKKLQMNTNLIDFGKIIAKYDEFGDVRYYLLEEKG